MQLTEVQVLQNRLITERAGRIKDFNDAHPDVGMNVDTAFEEAQEQLDLKWNKNEN